MPDSFQGMLINAINKAHDYAGVELNQTDSYATFFLGDITNWGGDPLDVADITNGFRRGPFVQLYGNALLGGASAGVVANYKVRSDYLSMAERAFRVRHSSIVNRQLIAAGRLEGHCDDTNGVFARVAKWADDLKLAGMVG